MDHNPARPCWNTPDHKIKSSFYFYISRRPYFYIRIYTIKQITRNQISSTCAHHWNNSQQFMCCREFFYFDPTDPTFQQHFIFFIPNRLAWFFCNNFFRDPSNKKMMALLHFFVANNHFLGISAGIKWLYLSTFRIPFFQERIV